MLSRSDCRFSAGILRNLSFESFGYLQEMLAQGVVPLLIEVNVSFHYHFACPNIIFLCSL